MHSTTAIYALTEKGLELALKLGNEIPATVFTLPRLRRSGTETFESLTAQVAETFRRFDNHIFITAAGIAVRCIAPHLRGKDADPAVVVMDQEGGFAISLLSGHLGGANELATRCAALVGGQAVVTTATDTAGLPSMDMLAKQRNMTIGNLEQVKVVNAALLEGRTVQVFDPGNYLDTRQSNLFIPVADAFEWKVGQPGVWISWKRDCPDDSALRLYPRVLMLGAGCRRGTPKEAISELIITAFEDTNLSYKSIGGLASIDAKIDEAGLLEKAADLKVLPAFFTREQLDAVEVPNPSERVQERMGVPSVAEASAILLANGGELIVEKRKTETATLAVARRMTC